MMVQAENMTQREREEFEQERTYVQLQLDYDLKKKELELEATRLENRWTVLLKIPLTIIKSPVYVLFGIAYIVAVARKHEPSEAFWSFLK